MSKRKVKSINHSRQAVETAYAKFQSLPRGDPKWIKAGESLIDLIITMVKQDPDNFPAIQVTELPGTTDPGTAWSEPRRSQKVRPTGANHRTRPHQPK